MGRSLDVQYMWQHTNMTRELDRVHRQGRLVHSVVTEVYGNIELCVGTALSAYESQSKGM